MVNLLGLWDLLDRLLLLDRLNLLWYLMGLVGLLQLLDLLDLLNGLGHLLRYLLSHGLVHSLLEICHLSRRLLLHPALLGVSPLTRGGHGGRGMCLVGGVSRVAILHVGDDAVDARHG